jgi:CRP/FNR family transcriptional regulator, cyclic AMP receptor protein
MAAPMSRAAVVDWLRTVPLFSDLSTEELGQLAAGTRSISARKHTRLFEEGAPADCCFVLTSGEARVVLSAGGDSEIVLGTVRPRGLVGEMALLDGSTRSATLVASRDCHFIRIPAAALDELRKNPRFEKKIVAHIIATLREANDQVRGISTISTIARVAWCLARIARQEGIREGTGIVIPRKTHHELAEMVGCSRETVSRKLEALKRKKCVSWDKKTMRIDLESLQRHARTELDANHVV